MADIAGQQPLHQVRNTWSPYARLSARTTTRLRQLWDSFGFNHDAASKLRYEVDMLLLRGRCALSSRFKRQVKDLATRRHLRVHLGCGNALLDGWVNLDCYPPEPRPGAQILTLDMRPRLPFASASVSALFSEHFLEHLPFDLVRKRLIPEILRVLEPGGRIRLSVPDGEYFIEQYIACRAGRREPLFDENRHGKTAMTMLNEVAHSYGHYFLYDFETLAAVLSEAGFVDIQRSGPGQTEVDVFQGLDRMDPWRTAMSLYVEARAPAKAPAC
jgi:predicted SAM-dependent methyltransferase